MPFEIRPMVADDSAPIAAAILADDWGDRRAWLDFIVTHPSCRPIVAVDPDGRRIGSAVATINGPVAWIGTIWVASDRRRQGIGQALTAAILDAADEAGTVTSLLVATELGRPMYEKIGFTVQTWYIILEAPGLPAPPVDGDRDPEARRAHVRPYRASDLPAMIELDAAATGERRGHLLTAFASPEAATVVSDAGATRGFVVRPPWGGGATIAPDPADALALLQARRARAGVDRYVRAGLPHQNEAGLERLLAAGWSESWRAPRLIRGEPIDWRPEAIWGQFSHALG